MSLPMKLACARVDSFCRQVLAAAEQVLASHPEYEKLQAISVAIIHPIGDGDARKEWHTEDVVEFRKGPNQRFSMHIT